MKTNNTILIVDDELGPKESLRMILKPFYNVSTASNGREALGLIHARNIEIVTLDLNMPGLSGIDVLKEIKKCRADIDVIIITGYGTLNNAQEAVRFGAGDFISKPFNVADVISIIGKAFERRRFFAKIKTLTQEIHGFRSSVGRAESFPLYNSREDR